MKRKKTNKLARFSRVYYRGVKRLRPKTVGYFLKKNLKSHPFITGGVFFFLVTRLITIMVNHINFASCVKVISLSIGIWLLCVWLSNLLKDNNPKWYLRKRFILALLTVYAPAGIVFLWSGSRFKKTTKIVLTVIFGLIFITYYTYISKELEAGFDKTTMSLVSEMFNKTRNKVFLENKQIDLTKFLENKFKCRKNEQNKFTVQEIADKFSRSVVSISTKDKSLKPLSKGSGFIISGNGLVVTNFHVVEGCHSAEIVVNNFIFDEVALVKTIPKFDIAILKIDGFGLPEISFGDSDLVRPGEVIVSIGNPLGLDRSVSEGVVSAIREENNIKIIQMTAPVSLGSSGGPIFNEYGQVVGITTLATTFGAQNLNFAIPINYLKFALDTK